LAQDFPSAYQVRLEVEKVRNNDKNTTLLNTTLMEIEKSSSKNGVIAEDC
jgi:hypothetical protein